MSDPEQTAKNMDPGFFKRTDQFISLANELTKEHEPGKISASMLYAAARFNAYLVAASAKDKAEADRNKVEALDYFTDQYRAMLKANLEDYVEKYDEYLK
ncbi:DUF3144 domain-containing protein [Bermanella sp. R86510]|uniref:DUF3144 domain-containing protein n=1 Tax=unclassified Bermanella TaxID=2627862 RepID=UPI0037C5B9B2